MKNMKKSVFSSVLALVLCLSMLLGTTFAWFTDSATSTGNVIQTGDLNAEMYWSNELLDTDSTAWNDASSGAIFNYDKWEPGYTELKYVKVANKGSLNLKWMLTIEAGGEVSDLSDVIDVYFVNPVTTAITSVDQLSTVGTLTDVLANKTNSTGSLTPDQSVILAIAFHMDEDAGNTYQNKSLCENGFSVKLVATQETGEFDSFGDQYDKDATWDDILSYSASATVNSTAIDLDNQLKNPLNIGVGDVNANLPSDVKLAPGTENLVLNVNNVETSENIILGEGDSAKSLNVHIEGIAADNTVSMVVNLGAVLPAGMNDTELKLYHVENGTPVLMEKVNSVDDFTTHNQYTYDSATGNVTIYVKSFSEFTFVKTTVSVWDGKNTSENPNWDTGADDLFINDARDFIAFRNLVDKGTTFEGRSVYLNTDIDLGGHLFDPIGFGYTVGYDVVNEKHTAFMGTFDGQGHVIYNLFQNGWDLCPEEEKADKSYDTYTYSTAGGGLFASIENATIMNIAISGANIVFECVDIGVLVGYAQGNCTFDNISIANSTIANYQRATGAVVGEVCYGYPDENNNYRENGENRQYSHVFSNITVYPTVTVSALWGDFDNLSGGVIGGKWDNNGSKVKVLMENVTTAAVLDVYSDVTAAYQWYAYRRCGMLIGNTEQSSPKQATHAEANFLTCDNVTVYYGDWVNYEYYEFADQDSATGQRYPWVRAQKGLNNPAFSNVRYGVPTYTIDGETVKIDNTNAWTFKTDYTPIVFDQLYGGGQGVYGCAGCADCSNHVKAGVTVIRPKDEIKTIYVYNDAGWTDLKLSYVYNAAGNNTWSPVVDGLAIFPSNTNNIYKVIVSKATSKFRILGKDKNGNDIYRDFITESCDNNDVFELNSGKEITGELPELGDGETGGTVQNGANG